MCSDKRRALVVDDQRDLADVVRLLLEERGFDARVVCDGQSALEVVRSFRPHVVFLDLSLPRLEGEEVARMIRSEHGRSPRLVALTGHEGADVRRRCLRAGFDAFMCKPHELCALERALDEHAVA